jgi:NADH dehydrogenase/NADH:ubiquinone oxidoreductase subunit G
MAKQKNTSEIIINIDGKEVKATEGMTVLQAAQSADIFIPTLCHHEKLEPFGACRICTVEIDVSGWTKLVAACLYPVEQDLVVKTRSEEVDKIRKLIVEFLLAHAPNSPQLQELAQEYGADKDRFDKEASFCILCGLCVRYCAEVKKKNAVGYINNGARREICFIPEIASKECNSCKECFPLCPTSYLQAAFLLTETLSTTTASSFPAGSPDDS